MKRAAEGIFKLRVPLLIFLTMVTVFLGYHASQLTVATDFSKMIPLKHDYIQDYSPVRKLFGGGNQIKVSVNLKEGDILSHKFLSLMRKVTEDVYFVKGVDRLSVRSLVSPETRLMVINEFGFDWGPVVPHEIPKDKKGIKLIGENITKGGLKGRLVANDMKACLITGEVYETGVDYLYVYRQLNEIREEYTTDNISVHISGFAMVVGFVNDALPKIFGLFGLSALITFLILYRCFRYFRLAILPLFSGALSVLFSLGVARLIGMSLDPMTSIIPFLVFAIGVSHGIQMVKRYLDECLIHHEGYNAALHALAGLMVPGVVALVTDAIGFMTIMFVPIGMINDLAITACIGVACIIVSNIFVLTLVLSFFPNLLPREEIEADSEPTTVPLIIRVMDWVAGFTYGKNAYTIAILGVLFILIGFFSARTMTVGDINPGEPLLWEDSVYNKDAAQLMRDYMSGIDWLSVAVMGDEDGVCKDYEYIETIQDFEWEIGSVPGVTIVLSANFPSRFINLMYHEGDIRWLAVPQNKGELAYAMNTAGSDDDDEMMSMGCKYINVKVFMSDHKGDTIRRVIKKCKEFIAAHPMEGARLVLAGGNVGVMAATNEVVKKAQVPMLFLIYLSIFILCLIVFRGFKAPLFILTPLFSISVISTAFMKLVGLGLNVNTLPVASLGVGIGVDYGIYIFSRLQEERKLHSEYVDAVKATLRTTGAAVLYTALTLSAGVLTWLLSDLKFQADMGLLLGFIFIGNMIGAMVLMPALIYIFDVKDK